jgi:MarR family transcriptional regulator, transcriptional regulator for hemolysin
MEMISDWETSPTKRIYRLGRMLRKRAADILAVCDADISPEQWGMLLKLRTSGVTSQIDLVDKDLDDRPNIARMIEGLVRKGFVVRDLDESDRRKRRIGLSEKGSLLVERVWPVMAREKERMFIALSKQERHMLLQLLNKIESVVMAESEGREKRHAKK